MKKYYFSIDIGGTTIKGGIVDENNNILCKNKVNTVVSSEPNYLVMSIMELIKKLEDESGLSIKNSSGLGVGSPGMIDSQNGIIKFSGNLKLTNYPLKDELSKLVPVPVKVANDADIATLAELKIGAGKNLKHFIMLTLGTGIGSGIVINGELLSNHIPLCGEIGHMKVLNKNIPCSCGEINCYETIASTSALSRLTIAAMQQNPESKMWTKYNLDNVNGKTVFDFLDSDETAKKVFDEFIENLGTGIVSLVNAFMPEAIILGGSVSNEKETLTKPLEDFVNNHIYAKNIGIKVNIKPAEATGCAGIVGGKLLFE